MYFKRIDMHGFKSFAEPVSIEFHEGITCIVGPNGSGKSNISDAIRWVLGEQSPKMLRGGKMEEVIFAGTANRKSRGMAEVTLTIDNSKNILPIDYNEVAITRRMFRSGESEYSINSNQCRLRDIRELIMDTGIGVDGYSLIGQGKISDIVSNKPESRREIFEEAAGIVKYRSKKAESERKLESANGNLERVNDIVTEIESRIGNLKEDSIKAKEYLKLKEQYKELEINVTLKNIENVELKNEYLKDDLTETDGEIQQLKEDKSDLDKDVAAGRLKNEELDNLSNETRDKLLISTNEINSLINQNQLNQEKLQTIDKDMTRLKEEITSLESKLEKEKQSSQEHFDSKSKIDQEVLVLEKALENKIAEYTEITGVLSQNATDLDNSKNKIFEIHTAISNKNSEINSMKSLQGSLNRRKEQILSEKNDSDKANGNVEEQFEQAGNALTSLKAQIERVVAEAGKARNQFNEEVQSEKETEKKLQEITVNIGQISARKKMIEEMESNYEGYNNAVKFIMKSDLRGIEGVVAELIEVPKGYEVAMETALGAALQNIVCQDDKSAQNAVSLLKSNKAGRLTFLPIQSIRGGQAGHDASLVNAEGFKGFGVECISFDSKYQKIMEYLLGRVVVVDKLENAVKLSKNRGSGLRFVTLEGEVINSGGAITGGTYRNNTANLLERKAEIATLGDKLNVLQKEQNEKKEKLDSLKISIDNHNNRIQSLDKEHRELEREFVNQENELKNLNNQITDIKSNREKWQRELDSIAEEITNSDKMINALLEDIEKAQNEIKVFEKFAEEGLVTYEEKKAKLEDINQEITQARIAVGKAESEKNNADTMVARIQSYINEINDEVKGKAKELEELESLKGNLKSGDTDVSQIVEEKTKNKVALERYLNEILEEKAELSKTLNVKMAEKDVFDEKLNNLLNKKYEMDIKLAKNETQLENYKNKLWDEFEISYIQAIEFKKKEFNLGAALKESREVKNRIKELGDVNVGSIKEYESVSERYEFLTEQRDDILKAMASLNQIIEDMDKTIRANFKESFDKIVVNFEGTFKEMFGGGTAFLRLEDETKPLDSGIEIVAQPPGKKLQNINLMSGGEKTMTAIALMFAVLKAKPTPFCILDEIEAALDDANIDRFARYLTNFKEIQFALVTHQKATMEYADVLYGVTMPEQGVSKLISLKLGDEIGV